MQQDDPEEITLVPLAHCRSRHKGSGFDIKSTLCNGEMIRNRPAPLSRDNRLCNIDSTPPLKHFFFCCYFYMTSPVVFIMKSVGGWKNITTKFHARRPDGSQRTFVEKCWETELAGYGPFFKLIWLLRTYFPPPLTFNERASYATRTKI